MKFANVPLLDQDGKSVRLEPDLVQGKIVVMSFIYTSCTTVCPVVSSILGKVQKQLGARVGDEVQLVSISIDPQRDDPKRLQEYARSFQQGPGWSWLTGSPQS
ncbi:SCO family protein, partial [Stenotrophomonas maltophilia]